LKKAKFHNEAEGARYSLGVIENDSRNIKQAVKHWKIAALAGDYDAMHELRTRFEKAVSRESIDSTLKAYNKSCVEMRSEARDACIHAIITDTI